jgi:hypothetical protein
VRFGHCILQHYRAILSSILDKVKAVLEVKKDFFTSLYSAKVG